MGTSPRKVEFQEDGVSAGSPIMRYAMQALKALALVHDCGGRKVASATSMALTHRRLLLPELRRLLESVTEL